MGLVDYVRAVTVRWVWLLVAAVLGGALAGTLGALSPPEFTARSSVYVAPARVDGEDGTAWAARIQDEVVPSIVRLARSSGVLTEVSRRLDLGVPAGQLADRVAATVERHTNLLDVSVTDADPARAAAVADAVARQVAARADDLLAGPSGPLLDLELVRPAAVPRFPSTPSPARSAALGGLAGAALAGICAGAAELARPRVRGRRDVGHCTTAPVLATLASAAGRRRPDGVSGGPGVRDEQLARLRTVLFRPAAGGPAGPLVVHPSPPGPGGAALVEDLRGPSAAASAGDGSPELVATSDLRAVLAQGPVAGVVVLADGRRTTRRELTDSLAEVERSGAPLYGVVVDGQLPVRARWAARLRTGVRGDATAWLEDRTPDAAPDRGPSLPARAVAVAAVAAVGFDRPLPLGLTTGVLAAAALLPLWLPTLRRSRGAAALAVLAGAGLVSGVLLAWLSSRDHEFARYEAAATAALVLTLATGVAVVLWARTLLSLPAVGTAFGLASLAAGIVNTPGSENAFKFELSFPLTVLVLSALAGRRRPVPTVASLLVLGALNVVNDARSAFAFTLLAAGLFLVPGRAATDGASGPGDSSSGRRWRQLAVLAALGTGGYWLVRDLILSGALGSELQERTLTQIRQTGSLLLGGRPEWTATWALMQDSPLGHGLGTIPSARDVAVAEQGISVTRIPTVEGYLHNYLMNGRFELHSAIADLWSNLGPAGLLLGLVCGALIVSGLTAQLARREASGLVCFLAATALWSLAFGPLSSGLPEFVLGLGLLLPAVAAPRTPRKAADQQPATVDVGPVPLGAGAR